MYANFSYYTGSQGPIKGNSEALATVTGIIDGTGSAGAAIGQVWYGKLYCLFLLFKKD